MTTTPMTTSIVDMTNASPVAIIDLLASLLEAEMNSIYRFMGEGSPHLSRATVEVRRPLAEMVVAEQRRARDLADLLDSLGSVPTPAVSIRRDEQYLAFLSLKFLLPKLVEEKRLQLERYENAVRGIKPLPQVPPEVPALLDRHIAELRAELAVLNQAAAQVAAGSKNAAAAANAKDPSQPAPGTQKNSDAGPAAG
jgi:hypothetical protein